MSSSRLCWVGAILLLVTLLMQSAFPSVALARSGVRGILIVWASVATFVLGVILLTAGIVKRLMGRG